MTRVYTTVRRTNGLPAGNSSVTPAISPFVLTVRFGQDGGRFAFKSAVNLLRSANPDHLDSSNMDRDALKFVVFRRWGTVYDQAVG